MFFLKFRKRIIGKMDLFSSIQLLRFDGDAETKTFTGGIFSLTVIIYLMSTFSSMIFETFDKLLITSTTDTSQANEPQPIYLLTTNNASHFMLGVEVWHFDLNTGPRYFDIQLKNSFMNDGVPGNDSVVYTMQPCTKNHWRSIPNGSEIYDSVGMQTWLCMPLEIAPVLKGKYYSDLQTTLDVTIKKCNNQTDLSRPCASQKEIDTYFMQNSPIYFTPFFINPLINPQNKDYLKFYLQDKYYTMFGIDYGMEMYIYNAAYQITTDESILPYSQNHFQNGSIVTTVLKSSYNIGNSTDIYGFVSFFRDPGTIIITRSFQKIIDAFSFVGGLLGSFLLVLIFVNFYNEASYEMRFASMYKVEKNSPLNPRKFNIGYYLLQSIYNILNTVKVKCKRWTSVKYFHQTREQMIRQLDVKYLFKKLHILQNAMMLLLTKSQLKGLMLQHQMTVPEAKRTRRIYGLKSKIKKMLRQKLKNGSEEKQKKSEQNFKTTSEIFPNPKKNSQNAVVNQIFEQRANSVESPIKQSLTSVTRLQTYQLSSSQSGESSDSSSEQENSQTIQQKLIEDLSQLKQQSYQNRVSATILKNLDPFVKQFYLTNSNLQLKQCKLDTSKDYISFEIPQSQTIIPMSKKQQDSVKPRRAKLKQKVQEIQQRIKQQQFQKKSNDFHFLQD